MLGKGATTRSLFSYALLPEMFPQRLLGGVPGEAKISEAARRCGGRGTSLLAMAPHLVRSNPGLSFVVGHQIRSDE